MLHTNNPIIKHKAGLLNLAEELGNVSKACKVMGVSIDTFYRITRDGFVFLAMGFTGAKAAYFKEAYINAFNTMEKQLFEKPELPVPTAKPDDELKYKLLNDMVLSMRFTEDIVTLPATEVINMVRALRMYQQQMAQLRTPDWVNGNIERVKNCAGRHFCDV